MGAKRRKKRGNNLTLIVGLLLLVAAGVYLYQSGQLNLMPVEVAPANTAEWVKYEERLLPAIPDDDQLIMRDGYSLAYDEESEQASWVAYLLTPMEAKGTVRRNDNFRADELIITGSATKEDYFRSGYDRGHLAPAGDMKWSEKAMDESFYMSNISPQLPGFNRDVWKELEEQTREWVNRGDAIYIVTGPVFKNGYTTTIGPNKVAVPSHYYKVLLDVTGPEYKGTGFIFKHEKTRKSPRSFMVTIDSVESFTGYDFFEALPDSVEQFFEEYDAFVNWKYN